MTSKGNLGDSCVVGGTTCNVHDFPGLQCIASPGSTTLGTCECGGITSLLQACNTGFICVRSYWNTTDFPYATNDTLHKFTGLCSASAWYNKAHVSKCAKEAGSKPMMGGLRTDGTTVDCITQDNWTDGSTTIKQTEYSQWCNM